MYYILHVNDRLLPKAVFAFAPFPLRTTTRTRNQTHPRPPPTLAISSPSSTSPTISPPRHPLPPVGDIYYPRFDAIRRWRLPETHLVLAKTRLVTDSDFGILSGFGIFRPVYLHIAGLILIAPSTSPVL